MVFNIFSYEIRVRCNIKKMLADSIHAFAGGLTVYGGNNVYD